MEAEKHPRQGAQLRFPKTYKEGGFRPELVEEREGAGSGWRSTPKVSDRLVAINALLIKPETLWCLRREK